ncbi:MAG: TonB-dependent receptor [Edaphobacter sp.]|uniref:TonB-dependent receptor n=1 Tax=Edaphobacter sp. TaxID=1934404 RepID=UPI0023A1463E|nr:TonB-dependent receptor [Edaphobacter sp.]MDE1175486.1 TonB-dependent receptor [Edaphobacter sp.]
MQARSGRTAAKVFLRTPVALVLLSLAVPSAHAVIVRGTVTDPLGAAVPGAHVQLMQDKSVAGTATAGTDGSFEIRSAGSGRFRLMTSAATFSLGIGQDFYGGRTDVVTRDVVLKANTVTTDMTVTATGIATPLEQTSSAINLIPFSALQERVNVTDDLRQSPGVAAVQSGQYGGVTSLFIRGGNSDANKVLIDGITSEDIGGRFDYNTVTSTALDGFEMYRGPNSVLYGSDAAAGVVNFRTPRGATSKPVLNYTGDAGNFHTWRNEVTGGGTYNRLDYYGAFSRFDSSNALPLDRYHIATSAANLGYNFTANTQLRFTIRDGVSATGVPNAHDFFGISAAGKQADQNLYSGATLENRHNNWHNLVRYGIARKREQAVQFYPVGELIDVFGFGTYFGNTVNIRGANGYSATGRAAINYAGVYPAANDQSSLRDELYFQSDYTFNPHMIALFGFRYEDERGSYNNPSYFENEIVKRTNYQYTLQFQGDIKNRLFYSMGGAIQRNNLYGTAGTPRFGLAWVPVRPGNGFLRGTKLRANAATGVQEPSLSSEFTSLYKQLQQAGATDLISAYNVRPLQALRSRTFDVGIDQNIIGQKLVLKAGYFHNQFSHQMDYVDSGTLLRVFGIDTSTAYLYGALLNTLAFRAQGFEAEAQYAPTNHILVRGGYTYLATVVEQSFSTDAAYNGSAAENPNLPGVPIGSSYPLVGQRAFRRPPQTGFFAAQYEAAKWTAALKGAFSSRSDDSTFLSYSDLTGGNTLLLPNRNLAFGYAKLDAYGTYAATRRVNVFVELSNLLSQQHIGPIGYPGLPFTFRAGLKVRLGGN